MNSIPPPKRRRLDHSSSPSVIPAAQAFEHDSTSKALNSSDGREVLKALQGLKEKISSKKEVIEFLERSRPSFRGLITLFQRSASEVLMIAASGDPTHRDRILRETISLLANFCHFSLAACVELNSSNLTPLFLRILESGDQTDNSIKANILRLLGNLANQKETSSIITSNASNLLDRIASTIIHEDSLMAERALRVIRLLARRPKANAKVCSVYTSKKVESE